jgi:hypothetical protein
MGSNVVQVEPLGRGPIAIGFKGDQKNSEPVDLGGYDLVALYLPPGWVTGNITFLAAHRQADIVPMTDKNPTPPGAAPYADFLPVFDQASNAPTITAAAASRVYHLNPALAGNLRGLRYIKVVSSNNQNIPFTIYGIVSQGAR